MRSARRGGAPASNTPNVPSSHGRAEARRPPLGGVPRDGDRDRVGRDWGDPRGAPRRRRALARTSRAQILGAVEQRLRCGDEVSRCSREREERVRGAEAHPVLSLCRAARSRRRAIDAMAGPRSDTAVEPRARAPPVVAPVTRPSPPFPPAHEVWLRDASRARSSRPRPSRAPRRAAGRCAPA